MSNYKKLIEQYIKQNNILSEKKEQLKMDIEKMLLAQYNEQNLKELNYEDLLEDIDAWIFKYNYFSK